MKDKKSLYLAFILGLFIVAVGMISFIVFSNVKENNKVFINNEVQLGDDWNNCVTISSNYKTSTRGSISYGGNTYTSVAPASGNTWYKFETNTNCDKGYYCYTLKKCTLNSSSTPAGTTADGKCKPGYRKSNGQCVVCPNGRWSDGGDATTCFACGAGFICKDGTRSQCPSNTYTKTDSSSECTLCNGTVEKNKCVGNETSCSEGYRLNNGSCVACGDGYWSNGGTVTSCSPCPAGYSCQGNKKTACTDNTYSAGGGSKCLTCNGKVNDAHTSCEVSQASQCSKGYRYDSTSKKCVYCSGITEYQPNAGQTKCLYCTNGKVANADHTDCISGACPLGYYLGSGGNCITCTVGHYCNNGSTQTSCSDGYYQNLTGQSSCKKCSSNEKSNANHTACVKKSSSNPSSSDKCYRDTNNDYQVGNYNNQPGYTLVSNETKNCNNIKVKKVDSNTTVLTGATITFTDSSVPPVTRTFNIGETDINMTNPGTYTIVETVAPTGYQIDNTPIQVIVNDDGTINVTGGTNIDLGTSNGTRNITLSIINNNRSPEPTAEEYCYVKRGNGTNNEYCFGNTDTSCVGYSEVVSGRTRETCTEDIACYQKTDGTYTVGKFDGQFGYQYFGTICPACYEDANGNYRWTNTPNANERPVAEINTIDKCVTPAKISNNKIIYIILIVVVAIALFLVIKSLKKGNGNNNMSTEY